MHIHLKMNLHKDDITVNDMKEKPKRKTKYLILSLSLSLWVNAYIVYFYLCLLADGLWLFNIMATKTSPGMKNLMKMEQES